MLVLHASGLDGQLLLWGETPPASARSTLRAYVSRLRKALDEDGVSPADGGESGAGSADGVLLTRGRGYLLPRTTD